MTRIGLNRCEHQQGKINEKSLIEKEREKEIESVEVGRTTRCLVGSWSHRPALRNQTLNPARDRISRRWRRRRQIRCHTHVLFVIPSGGGYPFPPSSLPLSLSLFFVSAHLSCRRLSVIQVDLHQTTWMSSSSSSSSLSLKTLLNIYLTVSSPFHLIHYSFLLILLLL